MSLPHRQELLPLPVAPPGCCNGGGCTGACVEHDDHVLQLLGRTDQILLRLHTTVVSICVLSQAIALWQKRFIKVQRRSRYSPLLIGTLILSLPLTARHGRSFSIRYWVYRDTTSSAYLGTLSPCHAASAPLNHDNCCSPPGMFPPHSDAPPEALQRNSSSHQLLQL